ncbi:uncharacterized protein LOC126589164 isoform X5 [Malus sylvestris]|uniref:uncharacterized protein LOC126589164 isoform X5 n=1 Tax=Malus sylvestris TaxID=3752 RepID=UPI0021AD41CC|nr:uncharacterized protein LOC126589164 isoform X5 [Malus sylvestris]
MRRRFWTRNREGDGTGLSYSTSSPWNVLDPRGKNDLLLMECPLICRSSHLHFGVHRDVPIGSREMNSNSNNRNRN